MHTAFFFSAPGSVYDATKSGTWGDARESSAELGEDFVRHRAAHAIVLRQCALVEKKTAVGLVIGDDMLHFRIDLDATISDPGPALRRLRDLQSGIDQIEAELTV